MNTFKISGNIVDIQKQHIYAGTLEVEDGLIKKVIPSSEHYDHYILPGFIDAHVHIESSMLVPTEFARLAVVHGTVATISDPHEIANVLGVPGVTYMLDNGKKVPFKFYFGAPSCVPATSFETAGAEVNVADVELLLKRTDIKYLSEMMNFPGVLNQDETVIQKIAVAKKYHKPVDGHAPGLRGEQAHQYIAAGISTDHECFTEEEALGKLKYGMKILIREGSAARNFDALINLLHHYPDDIMFCSDDKHPDSLVEGHIDELVKRALKKGINIFNILKAACINPVIHYKLDVGLLQKNDPADFIVVNNLEDFKIIQTFINGELVANRGETLIAHIAVEPVNQFNCHPTAAKDFSIPFDNQKGIRVIEALDGQLITNSLTCNIKNDQDNIISDTENDILKIAVINRYQPAQPAVAFIKNFGLKNGAIASSVAHDSHNIIAVGVSDNDLARAVNLIIKQKGGICLINGDEEMILPLSVAGLMSTADGYDVAEKYAAMDKKVKQMGSNLRAPFMTLSFMALLVIPHLKLSDKGLFDADKFSLTPVEIC